VRAPASFKYGHFAGVCPLSMSVLREKREERRVILYIGDYNIKYNL